jgi:antitoxin ParD1/3/4
MSTYAHLEGVISIPERGASPGERADMQLITVKMSEIYVNGLDKLVESGLYPSRSEAIRVAIRDLLRRELWVDGVPIIDNSDAQLDDR